ncbi:hypothetical protein K8T06_14830, partial [bacterium]|nr:hypothetical protein [bacterium]
MTAAWSSTECSARNLDLHLPVGVTGLVDNVEDEIVTWNYEHQETGWHISTNRSWSGNSSWYCGNLSTMQYDPVMDCSLTSPPIFVTEKSTVTL